MTISPDQAARVARQLYPEEFERDPTEAIIRALDWLFQAEKGIDIIPNPKRVKEGLNLSQDPNVLPIQIKPIQIKPWAPTQKHKDAAKEAIKELAALMKRDRMTIGTMAASLDIADMSLRNWLAGSYIPSKENLEKIRAYLAKR
jgi:hypothetical protein